MFKKFSKIHKKTPALEALFNKPVGVRACNFIKKWLHRFFPVKLVKFLRIPTLKKICKPLLLPSGPTTHPTAQKMKFSIKDFFGKCDQIRRKLRIWSHLLKNSLMENFIFCVVAWIYKKCYVKGKIYQLTIFLLCFFATVKADVAVVMTNCGCSNCSNIRMT